MRTHEQIVEFKHHAQKTYLHECKKCQGSDPDCKCYEDYQVAVSQYEACIPKDFWNVDPEGIDHNKKVFVDIIQKYVDGIHHALKKGYGFALLGSNGVGKTYFISYVLSEAIKNGRTAYYTTMPQLAYNIKCGFDDIGMRKRLEWYLTSDFLAIDELGKEKFHKKEQKTFIDTEIERMMKNRCDDALPVILAANMNAEQLFGSYGATIGSIIMGKMKMAAMKDGDYRQKMAKSMNSEMGYR
jgi:DNA replication protein DnaC